MAMYQVKVCYSDETVPSGETELLLTVPTVAAKLRFLLDSFGADTKVDCIELYYQDIQKGLVRMTRDEFGLGPLECPKVTDQ